MDLAQQTVVIIMKVSAPVLILGMVVGLGVSILQVATQIQEASLSFVPKLVAIFMAILIFGSWMLRVLTDFTTAIFSSLGSMVR